MSSDIRSILQRLTELEEAKLTPTSVKHGLNPQQKSVNQLPALFKPHRIRALGAKTDPTHPMSKELVGDSAEPAKNALDEAMQEVEEDMLSKVKKDLTKYLDKLEKKVRVDRALKDKAKDAVEKHRAEEDLDENDYELDEPETDHAIQDKVDTALSQPQQPVSNMESAPVKTYAMEDGINLECWGNETDGFVLRRGNRELPSRFKNLDHADMAVKLYNKRRAQQASMQSDNQDYMDER